MREESVNNERLTSRIRSFIDDETANVLVGIRRTDKKKLLDLVHDAVSEPGSNVVRIYEGENRFIVRKKLRSEFQDDTKNYVFLEDTDSMPAIESEIESISGKITIFCAIDLCHQYPGCMKKVILTESVNKLPDSNNDHP